MALQVIESKVQRVVVTRAKKGAAKFVPGTDSVEEKEQRFRVTLGTYIEFNDGCTIKGPDGRMHKGKGTIVRFNYQHGTWSVQSPERCETNVLGYEFTVQNEPCWLKAGRESGMTTQQFNRKFSPDFVKLCLDGQPQANAKADEGNRRAA